MTGNHSTEDGRVTRRYFFFPAYVALVFLLAVLMMLPTIFYGGAHLILEESGPYIKWYFLYCIVLAAFVSGGLALRKYLNFDRPIKKLSAAARQVAEGDFSVYIPKRHTSNDMDYIDALFVDFNKMVEELGSIETLKNDFAANVSHELKTPLAAIQNYAQLLDTTELTPIQQEYTDRILSSTQRLTSLIYNILKLNKLESQKIQPKPEPYDLCRQLSDCAIGFEAVWEQKNINFEADMEDRAVIEADEELMELVWNNLLSNAFKFTKAGGTVSLHQFSDGERIITEVGDTGCGMTPEMMKHMFDKFYQGDTSHSTEGNGLGLALVLRVLEMSGGTITVNSTEGKGTVFTVSLPRTALAQKEESQTS